MDDKKLLSETVDLATENKERIWAIEDEIQSLEYMYREQLSVIREQIQRVVYLLKKLNIHRKEKTFEEIQQEVIAEMKAQGLNPYDITWEKQVDWMLNKDAYYYDQDIKNAQKDNTTQH
jgi:hypothetical protein